MERDYLVIIYQRERLEDDKNLPEGVTDYVLNPLLISEGKIKEVDGEKIFSSKDGKYELKMINSTSSIDDEFSYAFPIDVTEYDAQARKETVDYIKEEELYNSHLMQSYSKDSKSPLRVIAHNKLSERVLVLINPDSYDESEAVIEYDASEYVAKLKENSMLLIGYKDIEMMQRQKEEEEIRKQKYEFSPHKATKYSTNYVYADELYDEIRKYVIAQDEQIKKISTIFAKNQRIDNPYMKSNFILCGPTGVGKTEIFRRISDIANVPMIIEDANEFTAAGYVGRTVTDILINLYNAADGDLKKAENGIALIDEIDKKAGERGSDNMEVTKGAVIQSLLKMIEGHVYPITIGKKQIYFDTSRVTFAFNGAFSGIERYIKKKKDDTGIGFGANLEEKKPTKEELYNTQTLKDYGLLPEFIGRNRIIAMNELSQQDLERILKESKLSYLKLYREYLAALNIEFKYNKAVIEVIAKKAMELKTGARSLQSITEDALSVADFYIGSRNASQYKQLVITPKTIEDNKKFILR